MAKLPRAPVLILAVLRISLGGLFIFAGILKIADPVEFLTAIETLRILPYSFAYLLAFLLPSLEIVCGVSLIIKKGLTGALLLLTSLMTVFIFAIGLSWFRGLDIVCGCFGDPGSLQTNYPLLLIRNVGLLVGLAIILMGNAKSKLNFTQNA